MSNWWFALVVFGFGLFLTIFVDRLRDKKGPSAERRERRRWLEYWFFGRFPSKEEQDEEDKDEEDQKKPK